MSGGSWDYFYSRLEDVATRMQCESDPIRKAFGSHLQKCADALRAVEWVDSCDTSPGDEIEPIKAVLGADGPALILNECIGEAERVLQLLQSSIALAKGTNQKGS